MTGDLKTVTILSMTHSPRSSGNVFLYVLIAVVLFAGLSFALSRSNDSAPQNDISAAQTEAAVSEILAYAAHAQSAVEQMIMNGANFDDISSMIPSNSSFNTAPTINKLYHPDGGGLQYKSPPLSAVVPNISPESSYVLGRIRNVLWTPTNQFDFIFFVYGLNETVCRALNQKILNTLDIPIWSEYSKFIMNSIVNNGLTAEIIDDDSCPDCKDRASVCVKDLNDRYVFYMTLVAR